NWRVTGHPLRVPYQTYDATYSRSPIFLWSKPYPERTYTHEEIRNYNEGWAMHQYNSDLKYPIMVILIKTVLIWKNYLGFVLTIPLLWLAAILRSKWMRLAALTCLL